MRSIVLAGVTLALALSACGGSSRPSDDEARRTALAVLAAEERRDPEGVCGLLSERERRETAEGLEAGGCVEAYRLILAGPDPDSDPLQRALAKLVVPRQRGPIRRLERSGDRVRVRVEQPGARLTDAERRLVLRSRTVLPDVVAQAAKPRLLPITVVEEDGRPVAELSFPPPLIGPVLR